MLVLSRDLEQSIVIGQDIVVTVVAIQGHRVRLGIVAPAGVPVHRKEVFDSMKTGGKDAQSLAGKPKTGETP